MDAADFMPTRARAEQTALGLPAGVPVEERRLCALMVRAEVLLREVWSELQVLSAATHEELAATTLPARGAAGAMYHLASPPLAQGDGWVRCRVDHYCDKHVRLHETWIPRELKAVRSLPHLETALEALIMPADAPEALRCLDLTPRSHGGAYRSAAHVTRQPEFHGFSFSDTIDQAKNAVDQVLRRGSVLGADIRAYAWPILWLGFEQEGQRHDYVLFVAPDGKLHVFTAVEPDAG
jgi:hypothetical protein